MTKSKAKERLQEFINEILDEDRLIDEYEFRNLDKIEILKGIEDYLFD